jgi:hypothetical protein
MNARQAFKVWHQGARAAVTSYNGTLSVVNGRRIGLHKVGYQTGLVDIAPRPSRHGGADFSGTPEGRGFTYLELARWERGRGSYANWRSCWTFCMGAARAYPAPRLP